MPPIRLRQGRILQGGWIVVGGVALVAASFMWAAAIGGKAIEDRFSGLIETGLFITFQENRGLFLDYTFRELLFQFPLGAGLGRWGMMQVYFRDPSMWHAPPIHVEIQITGWLLDGGFLMWMLLRRRARVGRPAGVRVGRRRVRLTRCDTCPPSSSSFQLAIIGLCLTGPVFNTQLGVLFWTVTGALSGAMRAPGADSEPERRPRADDMTASRTRRFVGGLSVGYLHTAIVTIVGLWLTPYLLRHLDQHDYGLWLADRADALLSRA